MQSELYWSISKIINRFARTFDLGKYERILKSTWGELSTYTHFSVKFFNILLSKPEEIWIEHYDKELLEKCCKLFLITTDLFLSIIVIQFPMLRNLVKERIVDWWNKNLNVKLEITNKIFMKMSC